ncbi:hypothetical protein A5790_07065 [Mycobacterium sp. 852002-51152_SCH6134967]|uniref:hypothetical protein n=1 Tax=Mycobacterium sp. 852002-51152_SCH6134967 TaxID=1834096 RepID=UPI0007FB999E|nr:hypothetical protein [Mycobacterium sp. 852002-51152_SCH6134967]OBF95967.1 hypothetical protein A5790_07065 [Mycobacterium sp. 852002-51152_SCH6134967]
MTEVADMRSSSEPCGKPQSAAWLQPRTVGRLRASGFTVSAQNVVWRGMPAIVHPLAMGRATRT